MAALDADSPPTMYFSENQSLVTDMVLAIRTGLPDGEMVRDVERIMAGIDKDQPVYAVAPLQALIDHSLKTRRFVVWLLMMFAAAGTGLAALGLYGQLSYSMALRRREMGIRMALGAGREAVAMMVCRDGMILVAAGIGIGCAAAFGAYRWIASLMYGIGIEDGMAWIAVLTIVGAAGLIASAFPAWRVSRLNPADALRTE